MESEMPEDPNMVEDDDDDEERWRAEKAAQRLDYSGLSDVSSEFFDFDRLEVDMQQSESQQDGVKEEPQPQPMQVDSKRAAEHQPQTKRNRSDDTWWQARKDMEIGSVDDAKGLGESPTIDAVRRDGEGLRQATAVQGRRLRLARGITVDSGAADNVMPRRFIRGRNKIRPSPASRAGVHYVVANDGRIPNEGEAGFEFPMSWLFQIAEVNKTLAAVSALVDAGHKVTFDKDEATGVDTSFITHKRSGNSIKMRRERNVWVIDAYVNDEDKADGSSLFSRPE